MPSSVSTAERLFRRLAILRDSPEPFALPNHPDQQGSDPQRCEHICISTEPLARVIVCCACGATWRIVLMSHEQLGQSRLYARSQLRSEHEEHTAPVAPLASARNAELPVNPPWEWPSYDDLRH